MTYYLFIFRPGKPFKSFFYAFDVWHFGVVRSIKEKDRMWSVNKKVL